MLLAPGGSKGLAQIGRFYGPAYHKLEISREDITSMHDFLSREKDNLIEYAVRDALITLKHAL
jgi:hypothetical protein